MLLQFLYRRPFVKRFALCCQTVVLSFLTCPGCLSVTLVYCSQTVGWINMKLGMQVGLGHGHTARWGTSSPPQKGHSSQFSACICCGQMAAWITIQLGMEVGPRPGDFLLDGDPAPLPKKGAERPIFGPCLLFMFL